jgi:hypothetical protein
MLNNPKREETDKRRGWEGRRKRERRGDSVKLGVFGRACVVVVLVICPWIYVRILEGGRGERTGYGHCSKKKKKRRRRERTVEGAWSMDWRLAGASEIFS